VKVTEHCASPGLPVAVNVQLVALKLFGSAGVDDQLTVPVGADAVPGLTSRTVAVQLVPASTGTVASAQSTVVAVARSVAITVVVPVEPRWLPSPP
jgi:hypothetical protein